VAIFTQHWLPDDPPRAVVVLAHGIGEHSGRYAHVAAYLTAHGYALYALDHRGHGRSGGERVTVKDFDAFTADLRSYFEQVRAQHPSLPIFLYGHSMGSIIGLLFAEQYQDDLAGLITTGTTLKPLGIPPTVASTLLKPAVALMSGARLIKLEPVGVSRDPAVVAAYERDPLVFHGRMPFNILHALVQAIHDCIEGLPDLRLPYLVLHGGADVLAHVSAVEVVRAGCASPDLTIKVYEGLHHEIHNEPEQAAVLGDVVVWMDKRVVSREF
jgi:lysophospholipase